MCNSRRLDASVPWWNLPPADRGEPRAIQEPLQRLDRGRFTRSSSALRGPINLAKAALCVPTTLDSRLATLAHQEQSGKQQVNGLGRTPVPRRKGQGAFRDRVL